MKLSPSQQKIVDYLESGEWKCMANAQFFMKDDRKRISELNQKGYKIIGMPCDKRCGVNHASSVLMRQMIERPQEKETTFVKGIGHLKSFDQLVAEGMI